MFISFAVFCLCCCFFSFAWFLLSSSKCSMCTVCVWHFLIELTNEKKRKEKVIRAKRREKKIYDDENETERTERTFIKFFEFWFFFIILAHIDSNVFVLLILAMCVCGVCLIMLLDTPDSWLYSARISTKNITKHTHTHIRSFFAFFIFSVFLLD